MPKKNIGKYTLKKVLISILAIFLIIICVGPVFFIFWNSPKTLDEYGKSKFAPPENFENFINNLNSLIKLGLIKQIINTIIFVITGIILTSIFASISGYAFDKLVFPGRNIIYWVVIGLLAMPTQVFIIPLFVLFSKLNLTNNLFTLAILHTTFNYGFGTFLMKSFYTGIPNELLESARIDGANSFDIYLKIMLPLGKPAIVTLSILNFFGFWNDLFIGLIFNQSENSRVITPGIAILQQAARAGSGLTQWTVIFTAIIISLIFPLIIYIVFQNRLSSGITVGAIKG